MRAIILIGGFGTRLRPLTLHQPKALLPVLNRPFLSYQFDLLKEAGVKDVILACGLHTRPWKKDFKKCVPPNMRLHFAFEPKPLGTGGAIRFAYDELNKIIGKSDEPFLVFNGDVFFDLPIKKFLPFHKQNQSVCTIALIRVKNPSRFGVVDRDKTGRVKRFLEKPKPPFPSYFINAGAYLIDSKWIQRISPKKVLSIERDLFPRSLEKGEPIFSFPMRGYWNDIGTPESYLNAHRDLLFLNNRWTDPKFLRKRGRLRVVPATRARVYSGNRVSIGKNVTFNGFVSCSDNVVIGEKAEICDSIILRGSRVEAHAQITGAIVGPNSRIGAHTVVRSGCVLGEKTVLPSYTRS